MKELPKLQQVPKHWPKHFNADTSPCDMIYGPCSCGAWHILDEDWVKEYIEKYGLEEQNKNIGCTQW